MTKGAKELLDSAFGKETAGRMLILPEYHTHPGAQVFVETYAEEFKKKNAVTHFLETPYWLNPVLQAHFDRRISDKELRTHINANADASYITDEMRELWAQKIITSHQNGILSIGIDVRSSNADFWNDEMMQVMKQNNDSYPKAYTDGQKSQIQAWEFKNDYPQSVRYKDLIDYMSSPGRNVPEDSIHAVLAALHMQDRGGNAILTYGEHHIKGAIGEEVQGILDDVLKNQGVHVIKAFVANTADEMMNADRLRHQLKDINENKNFISDTTDYHYVIEIDQLYKNKPDKINFHKEPYAQGGKLADYFNAEQTTPQKLPLFDLMVARARLDGYSEIKTHAMATGSDGKRQEPYYKVVLNDEGKEFFRASGQQEPQYFSRTQLREHTDLVKSFDKTPLYGDAINSAARNVPASAAGIAPP